MDETSQLEEKLARSEEVIQGDPASASAYYGKGQTLYHLRRYDEALIAFEQAIRFDPNRASSYNGKGAVLMRLRRNEEALHAFDQSIQQDPTFVAGYKNKGGILLRLKRYKKSLDALDHAHQLNPSDESVIDLIKQLKRYNARKSLRRINLLYMEFWRALRTITIAGVGLIVTGYAFQANIFFGICSILLTIGMIFVLWFKTFRPVKRRSITCVTNSATFSLMHVSVIVQ